MLTRLATIGGRPTGAAAVTPLQRRISLILATMVAAMAVIFWPTPPATAAPTTQCNESQWQDPSLRESCLSKLPAASSQQSDCMGIPTPERPDAGFGGWFASQPSGKIGMGMYSQYGYAGYEYPVYTPDCVTGFSGLPSSAGATTTIANGELMIATGIVGAANAFRERAYQPNTMWGWADNLVTKATKAIYQKVFTVFGVITLAIVGLYLLWRSRQANMSDAMTTAGWAILVMVVVTAVAAWPLVSAHLADSTLVSSLGVVHDAVGPQPKDIPLNKCPYAAQHQQSSVPHDPSLCYDHRSPAVRASDTATETILYNNWLRGTLGSATSSTAKKYGAVLYDSSSLTWAEAKDIQQHPDKRTKIFQTKAERWQRVAQQIKTEDPDAYNYLQGKEGGARIGAGLIALISALGFGFFDIAASLLILLGFLIFRWAVVALPVIGTIAILRPASGGFKRLINIVVAAIFNILIFGVGASVYLFAVDLIMNTTSLPGWLQITLVWLCGVVGWLLLRPFRRITQLGGKNPMGEVAQIGSWHKRFFGDLKDVAKVAAGTAIAGDLAAQEDSEKKNRRDNTADPARPASGEPAPADGAPTPQTTPPGKRTGPPDAQPPTPPGGGDRPVVEEPVPVATSSGYGTGPDPYVDRASDDRVWVPATGRYANGEYSSSSDLSTNVGRANDEIAAYASSAERESQDYYQRAHTRS